MKEIPISYLTIVYHLKFNCRCVPEPHLAELLYKEQKKQRGNAKNKDFSFRFPCICFHLLYLQKSFFFNSDIFC